MRKTVNILVILCIAYNIVLCQNDTENEKPRLVITTSLFEIAPAVIGLPISIFNLGTDISLNQNYSFALNAGYIYSQGASIYASGGYSSMLNFATAKDNGFRVQAEIRRYLNRTKLWDPGVLLFPPHIFQYETENKWNAGYYLGWLTDYQYTESKYFSDNHFKIYRHAAKLHAIFGYQCFKSYHAVVDFSVGAGIQYIFSESPQRTEGFSESGPWGQNFHEESGLFPSVGYKLRVGFWL